MLIGNKLTKLDSTGSSTNITTDDIPEGEYNKYDQGYPDGKVIGDIFVRMSNEDISGSALLDGTMIYEYVYPTFYNWAYECKEKAEYDDNFEYFNKTIEEYEEFLTENTFDQTEQSYCPYFVISETAIDIYSVIGQDGTLCYTPVKGEAETIVESGYIYSSTDLLTVKDTDPSSYTYTGGTTSVNVNYVKLPTYPTYTAGSQKAYWFIVISSRVDDDTTSIRTVAVNDTYTVDSSSVASVRNVGTVQNLLLDFYIPRGKAATLEVGNVTTGYEAEVTNTGTDEDAILDFVIPRGEQGIAGGVVSLTYIGTEYPDSATNGEVFYNADENIIYTYEGGEWVETGAADEGVIYIQNDVVYHFDGATLVEFSNVIDVDNETLTKEDGTIKVIGVETKNGVVQYDWVGTLLEWYNGRTDGSISDDWLCYITDDGITTDGTPTTSITSENVEAIVSEILEEQLETTIAEAINTAIEEHNSSEAAHETILGNIQTILDEIISNS